MVFGGGPLGIIRFGWGHDGISVLEEDEERYQCPLHLSLTRGHSETAAVCKPQEEGSHQEPNLPAPWPWTSQPPEPWEVNVCCLATWSVVFCYSTPSGLWIGSNIELDCNWECTELSEWAERRSPLTSLGWNPVALNLSEQFPAPFPLPFTACFCISAPSVLWVQSQTCTSRSVRSTHSSPDHFHSAPEARSNL